MSSPALHIKDSYFFEVPKFLWRSQRDAEWDGQNDFPDFWIALDDDYLRWEADRFVQEAQKQGVTLAEPGALVDEYVHWMHADHKNVGRPFVDFLRHSEWIKEQGADLPSLTRQLVRAPVDQKESLRAQIAKAEALNGKLESIQAMVRDVEAYKHSGRTWSAEKVTGYNRALDGKILIPQPFGNLKNLHEPAAGFCISKYMIVLVLVAAGLAALMIRIAWRMQQSDRPHGRLWNMFESMFVYMRDQVARPAIGKKEADKYLPLLWTIFFFILGLNLMGMVPWVGAPTSAFAVTLGLAFVTFLTGVVMGSKKFGPIGFWLNQVPGMDLPWYMAILLKPVIWVIEVGGMLIKHTVLGIRLLANMVAGHVVLLGIMAIAFSLQGATSSTWWIAAPISIIGSATFSLLELFVAFLQAYIFTFLSALFIGAAVHHH